jgi:hypothetical protein
MSFELPYLMLRRRKSKYCSSSTSSIGGTWASFYRTGILVALYAPSTLWRPSFWTLVSSHYIHFLPFNLARLITKRFLVTQRLTLAGPCYCGSYVNSGDSINAGG